MSFWNQITLPVEDIPEKWYNILPDLPEPLPPPMDPETGPSRVQQLPKFLLTECLKQEMSQERWIAIPEGVRALYAQAGRPRPLFRALNLEKKIGSKARLYYKAEFYSPTGSHKVNTALTQAYYAKEQGFARITTETGAGQWGTALAYAAALAGIKCTVYWVRAVHDWKVARRDLMKLYGAEVFASPSDKTKFGRSLYEKDHAHPGSLGIAISEGLEDALGDDKAVYCLGSVLNHVLLHQTIIGLETEKQFAKAGEEPDIMISCLGGGSNFGGFVLPRMGKRVKGENKTRFIAAQSQVAPNLIGEYRYDFADHAEITPLLKMYTLGHTASMEPIKGDGLRYHGCAPILSLLRHHKYIDTVAYPKDEKKVFGSAKTFVEAEGFLPAPESAYSICCAIDEATKPENKGKVIAFNISGHGFMDMEGYKQVLGL
jgi:tryptophan synthase beta chain